MLLPEFEKQWKQLGLSDNELQDLQLELLNDPLTGDVIRDTGGVRKMRFALQNRGKSGSIRIIYVDFLVYEKLYLITAYAKNNKDTLTKSECKAIKQAVEHLKKTLENTKGER